MPSDPQVLFDEAKCFGCFSDASSSDLLKLALLDRILAASGGGGGGATAPGGAPGDVQFNDAGAFGGFGDYNSGTGALTLPGTVSAPTFIGSLTGAASLNVLKTGDTMTGPLTIVPSSANTIPLTVSGYSLTGASAASLLDLSGTWNTTGNPTALRLAITNTASGATSKFLEFLAGAGGATSVLSISKAGTFILANGTVLVPTLQFASDSSSGFYSSGPGSITFASGTFNHASFMSAVGLSLMNLTQLLWTPGFDSVAAPDLGLGRNAAGIVEVTNGTVGAFRDIWARHFRMATAFTVATLPAAGVAGRMAYVTDALTPTFLTLAVGGGAIVAPVFDNGTTWVTV